MNANGVCVRPRPFALSLPACVSTGLAHQEPISQAARLAELFGVLVSFDGRRVYAYRQARAKSMAMGGQGNRAHALVFAVIASEAKQSRAGKARSSRLLRRFAPRNDREIRTLRHSPGRPRSAAACH
jgi:hypothetical protein